MSVLHGLEMVAGHPRHRGPAPRVAPTEACGRNGPTGAREVAWLSPHVLPGPGSVQGRGGKNPRPTSFLTKYSDNPHKGPDGLE